MASAFGDIAQLGERGLCKPEVVGSNPIVSTMNIRAREQSLAFLLALIFSTSHRDSAL
jgi:hypothetical protein